MIKPVLVVVEATSSTTANRSAVCRAGTAVTDFAARYSILVASRHDSFFVGCHDLGVLAVGGGGCSDGCSRAEQRRGEQGASKGFQLSAKGFVDPQGKGALHFTWRHSLGRGAALLAQMARDPFHLLHPARSTHSVRQTRGNLTGAASVPSQIRKRVAAANDRRSTQARELPPGMAENAVLECPNAILPLASRRVASVPLSILLSL